MTPTKRVTMQGKDVRFYIGIIILFFDFYIVYQEHIKNNKPWDSQWEIAFHAVAFFAGLMLVLQTDRINALKGVISSIKGRSD